MKIGLQGVVTIVFPIGPAPLLALPLFGLFECGFDNCWALVVVALVAPPLDRAVLTSEIASTDDIAVGVALLGHWVAAAAAAAWVLVAAQNETAWVQKDIGQEQRLAVLVSEAVRNCCGRFHIASAVRVLHCDWPWQRTQHCGNHAATCMLGPFELGETTLLATPGCTSCVRGLALADGDDDDLILLEQ